MQKILNWTKAHKIASVFIFLGLGFLTLVAIAVLSIFIFTGRTLKSVSSGFSGMGGGGYVGTTAYDSAESVYMEAPSSKLSYSPSRAIGIPSPVSPQMEVQDRMVVTDSHLSLLVEDVAKTAENIQAAVKSRKGYVVNTYIRSPQDSGAYGNMSIRVPLDQLDSTLSYLRGSAIKVVSENISGYDVTDQYVDLDSRLATLEKTKAIFEGILERATEVDDIMSVQQRILEVQRQIESIKGQQKYLETTSSSVLISLDLSTDEYSLPYSPGTWRPEIVFKNAVRALVATLRGLAELAIKLAVFVPIWGTIVLVVVLLRKRAKKNRANQDATRRIA